MLVYVAHPIDQVGDDEVLTRAAIRALHDAAEDVARRMVDVYAYRPAMGFYVGSPYVSEPCVEAINLVALNLADLVVAVWPEGARSVGTGVEIGRSLAADKPTILFTDMENSFAVDGVHAAFSGLVVRYRSRDIDTASGQAALRAKMLEVITDTLLGMAFKYSNLDRALAADGVWRLRLWK